MGNFHRFTDPAYTLFSGESFSSTPGVIGSIGPHNYDRINVVSGGVGASGSAPADGRHGAGVNQYTYFVHFGEDATALHANRGLRALAENTDILDDLLRTGTPKRVFQTVVGANQTRVVLTGDVFVGDSAAVPGDLLAFAVADQTSSHPYSSGAPIQASDIDNGTPGSSVVGDGFYTNPTVQLSAPLAAGSSYVFVFFVRTSTARVLEVEREELSKNTASLYRGVFDAQRVFSFGLNEFYRRSTGKPVTYTNNVAGSGAVIDRDGQALTMRPVSQNWVSSDYDDPFLSHFKVGLDTVTFPQTALDADYGGDIGFVSLGFFRQSLSNAAEQGERGRLLASHASLNVRSYAADTMSGATVRTRIEHGQAAVLNADPGIGGADSIYLSTGYFRSGGNTSIVLGHDLLLVTFADGSQEAYVIQELQSDTVARLTTLGGSDKWHDANTPVTVSWVQPLFNAGGGMVDGVEDAPLWGPLNIVYPTLPTAAGTHLDALLPSARIVGETADRKSLIFGLFDPTDGSVEDTLAIFADGHVETSRYYQGSVKHGHYLLSTNVEFPNVEVDPLRNGTWFQAGATVIELVLSHPNPTVYLTLHSATAGQHFELLIRHTVAGQVTLDCSADFLFSGSDETLPVDAGGERYWFSGIQSLSNGAMLMRRNDF